MQTLFKLWAGSQFYYLQGELMDVSIIVEWSGMTMGK